MGFAYWNAGGTVMSSEVRQYSNGEFVAMVLAVGDDQYPAELEVACFGNRVELAKTVVPGDNVMVAGRLTSPENDRGYRNIRISVSSLVVLKEGQAPMQVGSAPQQAYQQPPQMQAQPVYQAPQMQAQPVYQQAPQMQAQPQPVYQAPQQQVQAQPQQQARPQQQAQAKTQAVPDSSVYDEDIPF